MITKELYTENDYGVYKYHLTPSGRELAKELISFVNTHQDCYLSYYVDSKFGISSSFFDLYGFTIELFYKESNEDLVKEINRSEFLGRFWHDTDSYKLSDERISGLKENNMFVINWIERIIKLADSFDKLIKNEENI